VVLDESRCRTDGFDAAGSGTWVAGGRPPELRTMTCGPIELVDVVSDGDDDGWLVVGVLGV
jgi:hypothetical protein